MLQLKTSRAARYRKGAPHTDLKDVEASAAIFAGATESWPAASHCCGDRVNAGSVSQIVRIVRSQWVAVEPHGQGEGVLPIRSGYRLVPRPTFRADFRAAQWAGARRAQ